MANPKCFQFCYDNWLEQYCSPETKYRSREYQPLSNIFDESAWIYSQEADKKGPHGHNVNSDIKAKAEAFIADMAGDGFRPSIDDIRDWHDSLNEWYMGCCDRDVYQYPTNTPGYNRKLKNLQSRIIYILGTEQFSDT